MRFRPCIDIHNGKVKQIVGSSLRDKNDEAKENYVASNDAVFYARMYREMGLSRKLPEMSEDEQLSLLATDGMLVKRPLVVGDGFVLTGFKEEEWAEKLK